MENVIDTLSEQFQNLQNRLNLDLSSSVFQDEKSIETLLAIEYELVGFVNILEDYFEFKEIAEIKDALVLALQVHLKQSSNNGSPSYSLHVLDVATNFIVKVGSTDVDSVIAALLHDAVEDGSNKIICSVLADADCGRDVSDVIDVEDYATEKGYAQQHLHANQITALDVIKYKFSERVADIILSLTNPDVYKIFDLLKNNVDPNVDETVRLSDICIDPKFHTYLTEFKRKGGFNGLLESKKITPEFKNEFYKLHLRYVLEEKGGEHAKAKISDLLENVKKFEAMEKWRQEKDVNISRSIKDANRIKKWMKKYKEPAILVIDYLRRESQKSPEFEHLSYWANYIEYSVNKYEEFEEELNGFLLKQNCENL